MYMGAVVVKPFAYGLVFESRLGRWIICELSLFDMLFSLMPRAVFSPGSPVFPPSAKINMLGECRVLE